MSTETQTPVKEAPRSEPASLFPPHPGELAELNAGLQERPDTELTYPEIHESICGTTDDSQAVEQYDGTLGVSVGFVNTHQSAVGQLQWNTNLASIYTNPGDVNGVRWCSGTLISNDLFLTAGHCFDPDGGGWNLPLQNGTVNTIPPAEIATNMHVNFNYQVDPSGNPRVEQSFPITQLVEYRLGSLDFAIVRLGGNPGQIFGTTQISDVDTVLNGMACIIGHPAGQRKRIEAGPITLLQDSTIAYNDIDTLGGNSGAGILQASDGRIVGVHTNGGCDVNHNTGVRITSIIAQSPTLQALTRLGGHGISCGGNGLYQLHKSGAIWRYTGTPCSDNSCPGWQMLDQNSATVAIAAAGNNLYQLHKGGALWRYTGTPCTGDSCPGWQKLDQNSITIAIAAGGNSLYQLHKNGSIWKYTGTPCTENSCPGWQKLDQNSATVAIAADASGTLYQLQKTGAIWKYTGIPCTGDSCPGWQKLDQNPATVAIAVGGNTLYQLHRNGFIWKYTGTPCTGDSCPGWQLLDRNPATMAIAVDGSETLYQLHQSGSIWRHTGTPCTGESCPGWQMLDSNQATTAIAADGNGNLYQVHRDGMIWRYTGTPCIGNSCPGWQKLDQNAATIQLSSGTGFIP
jgi:V8-like Glu-specific endopeptidase